jgi:hypothetical protein
MSPLVSGARGRAGAEAAQRDQAQSRAGELPEASNEAHREAPHRVEPEGSEDNHLAPLLRAYLAGTKKSIPSEPRPG